MTITIPSETGEEIEYCVLTIFSLNDDRYIALIPVDEDGDPLNADIVIYACEEGEDGDDIYEIEDEDELKEASEAFQKVIDAL